MLESNSDDQSFFFLVWWPSIYRAVSVYRLCIRTEKEAESTAFDHRRRYYPQSAETRKKTLRDQPNLTILFDPTKPLEPVSALSGRKFIPTRRVSCTLCSLKGTHTQGASRCPSRR